MNEFIGAEHADEAMLMLDVSDEVLENAASSVREKAGAMTLAQVACGLKASNRFWPPVFSQTVELI